MAKPDERRKSTITITQDDYLKYRTYRLMLRSGEEDHKRIFESVAARDRDGAREALSTHISGAAQDVLHQLRTLAEERAMLDLM